MALTATPAATCTAGHAHVSWFAAESCNRDAAPMPSTYAPLTASERRALTGLPTSR